MLHTERFNSDMDPPVSSRDSSALRCTSDAPIINNHSESTTRETLEILAEGTSCSTIQSSKSFIEEFHRSLAALISVGKEKRPFTPKWQLATTDISDPNNIRQFYIGIVCGPVNNIDVVDCDIVKQEDIDNYHQNEKHCEQYKKDGYYLNAKGVKVFIAPKKLLYPKCGVRWMQDNFPGLEKYTLVVRSQSGGLHFYFKHADLITSKGVVITDMSVKIDSRGQGGQIISPFSRSTRSGSVTPQKSIPQEQQVSKCVECHGICGTAPGAYVLTNMIKPTVIPDRLRAMIKTLDTTEQSPGYALKRPHMQPADLESFDREVRVTMPYYEDAPLKITPDGQAIAYDKRCIIHQRQHTNQHSSIRAQEKQLKVVCHSTNEKQYFPRDPHFLPTNETTPRKKTKNQIADSDHEVEDSEENVKTKKKSDNAKSAYEKEEAAKDVEMYRPLNYHGGIEACEALIERHTGFKVKGEQMSSKDDCVFVDLGYCKNHSTACVTKKKGGYGTWIRLTRTELQSACYGKDHGLGCSNAPEVFSLLTPEEENARKLLDKVLQQKHSTTDHDVAEIMYALQPSLVERCNGYYLICGENNVWKLFPKVSESDLHIRVDKVMKAFVSEYKDRYLGWASNKHTRKVLREVKIPNMEKFIKTKYNCCQVAEVMVYMVPSDSGLAHKVIQASKDFLAFSDGRKLNLRTGVVSAIQPEDYINRTTGYPMPEQSDPNIRKRIMNYFNTSLREEQVPYLFEESSLALHGSNIKERVLGAKGLEGGGKTVYVTLFQNAMGGYAETLGLHVLTKEAGNQDSTNSQMFDLFTARLVVISEPGKNDVIIASKIKTLTSEKSKSRPLFGSNLTFENIALILIGTNYAPRYSDMEGIPRRVRIVEFPYQYKDEQTDVDEANKNRSADDPKIRLADLGLKEDIAKPEFIAEFMLLLMETYARKFSDTANNPNKSINEPASVHNYTLETLKESCNEGVVEFVENHIIFGGEENTHFVQKKPLHTAYQNRFRKSTQRMPLGQKSFYDELKRLKTIKEKKVENIHVFTGVNQGITLKALPDSVYEH